MVAATVAGILVVAFGPWRRGVTVIGVALVVASVARLVLNDFESGMLRVRSKRFDVPALLAVGALLIVLAANIPNQPS